MQLWQLTGITSFSENWLIRGAYFVIAKNINYHHENCIVWNPQNMTRFYFLFMVGILSASINIYFFRNNHYVLVNFKTVKYQSLCNAVVFQCTSVLTFVYRCEQLYVILNINNGGLDLSSNIARSSICRERDFTERQRFTTVSNACVGE